MAQINKPDEYFNTVLYTGDGTSSKAITGVGFQPDWVWLKARSSAYSHQLFDVVRGATKLLTSEATDAEQTLSGVTSFDSDGFTVGSDAGSNNNTTTFASWNWLASNTTASTFSNYGWGVSDNMIAYCFAEKKGFSKFGSYVGNGSTDGSFIYTGFKPAFVMIKVSSTTNDWSMYDNQRDPINQVDNYLQPNTSSAEVSDTGKGTDFLSNGFKLRTTHGTHNTSGATYIYMAFAESPLVGTNNIPAVAR